MKNNSYAGMFSKCTMDLSSLGIHSSEKQIKTEKYMKIINELCDQAFHDGYKAHVLVCRGEDTGTACEEDTKELSELKNEMLNLLLSIKEN